MNILEVSSMINTLAVFRIRSHFLLFSWIFLILSYGIVNVSFAEQNDDDDFLWEIFYPAFIKNPTCVIPGSIKVPASSSTGNYSVSWGKSGTSGVTYILQEATNTTFTAGLRQAYSGTGTTASIIGRSSGKTYYYRVKAIKNGYIDSGWSTGSTGCRVDIIQGCVNIAGPWRYTETGTLKCCAEGVCVTETIKDTGTITFQQNGCKISFSFKQDGYTITRKGGIDGNNVKFSGILALPDPNCNFSRNIINYSGSVIGNQMNLKGTGEVIATCDGISISCTARSTVGLSRLSSSGSDNAMVNKEAFKESSIPMLNKCMKIMTILPQ
jgi:hypothetical protein